MTIRGMSDNIQFTTLASTIHRDQCILWPGFHRGSVSCYGADGPHAGGVRVTFVNDIRATPTPDRVLESRLGLGRKGKRRRLWLWPGLALLVAGAGTRPACEHHPPYTG